MYLSSYSCLVHICPTGIFLRTHILRAELQTLYALTSQLLKHTSSTRLATWCLSDDNSRLKNFVIEAQTSIQTCMSFYISASLLIFSAEANLLCFFLLAFNALYMFFALVCASLHCVVAHVLCFDYSFLLFGILMPAFLCLVLRRSLCVLPALIQRLQQRSFCFHISWHIPVLFSVHICTCMYFSFLSFKLLMPLVMLVASALLISVVWHYTDLLLSVICFAFGFAWYVYSFN